MTLLVAGCGALCFFLKFAKQARNAPVSLMITAYALFGTSTKQNQTEHLEKMADTGTVKFGRYLLYPVCLLFVFLRNSAKISFR
jgi:hypothetical protein